MKTKIILKDVSFFKDLLFCSCRYCIGRHTVASIIMANNIAKNAYEYLNEYDRRLLAHDIRMQINDVLQHKSNINICDYHYPITMDALTRIVEYIKDSGLDYHNDVVQLDNYAFNIDQTGVTVEPYDNSIPDPYSDSFFTCYTVLLPWVKLANALDDRSQYFVEYKVNGEVKVEICFPIPIISSDLTNISIKYMPLNTYLNRDHEDSWIKSEVINNVTSVIDTSL